MGVTMFGSYDVGGASMSENPLIELLYGKGAHASPLACVEDLSGELAGSAVSGFPQSILANSEALELLDGLRIKENRWPRCPLPTTRRG
jgi:hypothetical protein